MMQELQDVFEIFKEMSEDQTISKNVKIKISGMQKELESSSEEDLSLKANKILSDLEEISNDVNIPMHVRMSVYRITSLLERLD